ncbi:hypothetical protein [Candidatus Poriferisodalis sp.]|uniref:hypothetical protein n=1 Tax=Candidatus Poriferisodalis sp. TaxID=3101277 RepID=UPI003B023150
MSGAAHRRTPAAGMQAGIAQPATRLPAACSVPGFPGANSRARGLRFTLAAAAAVLAAATVLAAWPPPAAAQADTQADAQTDTQADAQTDTQADAQTDTQADAQTDAQCSADEQLRLIMLFDISGSLRNSDPQARRREGGLLALDELRSLQQQYPQVDLSVAVDSFAAGYDAGDWLSLSDEDNAAAERQRERIDVTARRHDGTRTDYAEALGGILSRFDEAPAGICKQVFWFTDGTHDTVARTSRLVTPEESRQIDRLCTADGAAARLRAHGVTVTAIHLSASDSAPVPETLLRLYDRSDIDCPHPLAGRIINVDDVGMLADQLRDTIADNTFEAIEQPAPTSPCRVIENAAAASLTQCEFPFALQADTQAFEIFIDLKALEDPEQVRIFLLRPNEDTPAEVRFPDEEELHRPTGLLLSSATANWKKLRGHQAAEFSRLVAGDDWAWEGTWKIIFQGEQTDRARATPPDPVITTQGLPGLGPVIGADGRLEGQVSLPRTAEPFRGHVRLAVHAPGEELHGWRIGPTPGFGIANLAWHVDDIIGRLASVPRMDDYLRSTAGTVQLSAELVQLVDWGDETDIAWPVPGAHQQIAVTIAAAAWEEESGLHPGVRAVELTHQTPLTPAGEFRVQPAPGSRSGRLVLASVEATVDGEPVAVSWDGEWECAVPAAPGTVVASCPLLSVEPAVEHDAVASFTFNLTSTLDEAGRLVDEARAQGLAVDPARFGPMGIRMPVDGLEIRVAAPGETWRWFMAFLVGIVAVALVARFLTALELRKWDSLSNDQAFETRVCMRDGILERLDGTPVQPAKNELFFVPELTRSASMASVGAVRLRSSWRTALRGRQALITASGPAGECLSDQDQDRAQRGIVGESLHKGWALSRAQALDASAALVVWDLPDDQKEANSRIQEAAERAAAACMRLEFLPDSADVQPPGLGDGSEDETVSLSSAPTGARNPFGGRSDPLADVSADMTAQRASRPDPLADPLDDLPEGASPDAQLGDGDRASPDSDSDPNNDGDRDRDRDDPSNPSDGDRDDPNDPSNDPNDNDPNDPSNDPSNDRNDSDRNDPNDSGDGGVESRA